MQKTSMAIWVGGILALGAIGLGHFLMTSSDTGSAQSASAQDASAVIFETLAARSQEADFTSLSGPWQLSLPDDHGGHDDARTETWTFLVHLTDDDGNPLGVQFNMARLGLIPMAERSETNPFELAALYRAHVILSDTDMNRVFAEERLSRGMGAADHDLAAREVWLDDWLFSYGESETGERLRLKLTVEDVPISLTLTPAKPAEQVAQDQGLRGFAIPRLVAEGHVGDRAVQGLAILNRVWGDVPLPGGAVANDVLSIQLEDGSDLSLIRTIRRDGRGTAVLDGLISKADATILTLAKDVYSLEPVSTGDQDTVWRLEGPDLSLESAPLMTEARDDFAFSFTSGLLAVTGTRDGQAVTGLGSLQSTRGAR